MFLKHWVVVDLIITECVGCVSEERRLQELEVHGQAITGGSMSRRGGGSGTKRRWRRPISCISVKKFPSCKQSWCHTAFYFTAYEFFTVVNVSYLVWINTFCMVVPNILGQKTLSGIQWYWEAVGCSCLQNTVLQQPTVSPVFIQLFKTCQAVIMHDFLQSSLWSHCHLQCIFDIRAQPLSMETGKNCGKCMGVKASHYTLLSKLQHKCDISTGTFSSWIAHSLAAHTAGRWALPQK
jgi:hypothetical protein